MASRPPEHQSTSADPARGRFAMIALHRLLGIALIFAGILVSQGVIDWPEKVGWGLIALGMVDVFVVPLVLARMWRTPRP